MTRENGNGSADAFHSLDGPAPISVPRIAGNPPDLTFLVTIVPNCILVKDNWENRMTAKEYVSHLTYGTPKIRLKPSFYI